MALPADSELFEGIRAGDENAFTLLFQRHWKQLYTTALAKTADNAAAHDIVQELFLDLWEHRQSRTIHSSLQGYLYGMLRNRIFDYYRLSQKHEEQLQQLSLYLPEEEADLPELLSERAQKEQQFDEAVSNLPARIKEVYTLRCHNQYSFDTIAGILHIKPQTARNAYFRAKELLKQQASSYTISLLFFLLNNLFI